MLQLIEYFYIYFIVCSVLVEKGLQTIVNVILLSKFKYRFVCFKCQIANKLAQLFVVLHSHIGPFFYEFNNRFYCI